MPPRPAAIISVQESIFDTLNLAVILCSGAHLVSVGKKGEQTNLDLILFMGVILLGGWLGWRLERRRYRILSNFRILDSEKFENIQKFLYTFIVITERMTEESYKAELHCCLKNYFDHLNKKREFKRVRLRLEKVLIESSLPSTRSQGRSVQRRDLWSHQLTS